ncbi:MAG TPA: alkaline phosphatase family protein [Acidimicrobiales bacterium]
MAPTGDPTPRRPRHRRHGRSSLVTTLVGAVAVLTAACSSGSTTTSTTAAGPTGSTTASTTPSSTASGLPAIHHVFVIVLENEGYANTFGDPSADPYLASTLPSSGALLSDYYGIGHNSNDNYIALISGQAPNPSNQADCPVFADFPGTATVAADGQISGSGCVFPSAVPTVANQLTDAHLTWKGYMEDMGNIPTRESAVCGHPAVGSPDHTEGAVAGDGYATRHNPFVYFHSIIDNATLCDTHVVPLGSTSGSLPAGAPLGVTGLATDLKSVSTTPNFSFITPNLCSDGHDAPCVNQPGSPSGVTNVDTFLRTWVPKITGSPAFKKDGLLEITFDEADVDGGNPANATACCNEIPGPAAANPGIAGPGGGRTGAVLLSPFIKPGTRTAVPYNHFSTLATVEGLFGLTKLGQAKTVTSTFGKDVFTKSG